MERWATFDCYGTLVDWNGGIRRELERLFGTADAARLLERYHALEPALQAENPGHAYREVLTLALERLASEEGLALPEAESAALAHALPSWPVFPEAHAALEEARRRGWRLAVLSNTDADLIAASTAAIGVPFDLCVVASDIGSYKPAHRHWEAFFERTGAERAGHVHVAASLFHDIRPATELGLRTIWVNRLGEAPGPVPSIELRDLAGLPDALERLVAAA